MKAAESELIERIERAWGNSPRPPEGHATSAPDVYDDSAELEEALRGKHWRDVSRDTVYEHRLDLALLSPEGFRFYLPAWLLAALGDWESRTLLLSFFKVTRENGTLEKALSNFSDAERTALRAFFDYMAEAYEEEWGSARDWST
jgi:hypothetical protein